MAGQVRASDRLVYAPTPWCLAVTLCGGNTGSKEIAGHWNGRAMTLTAVGAKILLDALAQLLGLAATAL